MKYQVTFYNNLIELLTERRANFVNILKKVLRRYQTNQVTNLKDMGLQQENRLRTSLKKCH